MAASLVDLTSSRTKPTNTARLIYGALLGKPTDDSASPWLYEAAMEEYEEHARPGAGFDASILRAQRNNRAPSVHDKPPLGYLTERALMLEHLRFPSNGVWAAGMHKVSPEYEQTVNGHPHPLTLSVYDSDGLLVAWRDLLKLYILPNEAYAESSDRARRNSNIRKLATPSFWKLLAYYAADLTQLGSQVAEASKWWRLEVATSAGKKHKDKYPWAPPGSAYYYSAYFTQRYADLLREHQLRLLRSLEDSTDIIDGILVSFAPKVLIAAAPVHPVDVLEAHLLDDVDTATTDHARPEEQRDVSRSRAERASVFCVAD